MINSVNNPTVLFTTIAERRLRLMHTPFIKFIGNTSLPTQIRISYVPHMLFFIMGFKDILQELIRPSDTDPVQQDVNEHCLEDNGHWKWFLHDIKHMNMPGNFFTHEPSHVCAQVWSDENMPIRKMVYQAMSYCYQCQTPAQRMVILEVIEAIFSVFVENMNILVHQMGMYDTYLFFGRIHHDAESDHSNGSWLQGGKKHIEVEPLMSIEEKRLSMQIINGLFDGWEQMSNHWHEGQLLQLSGPKQVLAG